MRANYQEIFEQAHALFARDTHLAMLLDVKATLLYSNNSFVDLQNEYGQCIFSIFPFLEHLLSTDIQEVSINFIETELYNKIMQFRCIIRFFEQYGEQFYFVIMQDVSWYHHELQKIQQERNEFYIEREKILREKQ
ncbi:MAG: hypothetical protein RMJ97_10760 [Raineya sp.]|nr:hypothetical protein [Raineya sp.]MDW8297348.1 hypothetical protein [Raineya sp.]